MCSHLLLHCFHHRSSRTLRPVHRRRTRWCISLLLAKIQSSMQRIFPSCISCSALRTNIYIGSIRRALFHSHHHIARFLLPPYLHILWCICCLPPSNNTLASHRSLPSADNPSTFSQATTEARTLDISHAGTVRTLLGIDNGTDYIRPLQWSFRHHTILNPFSFRLHRLSNIFHQS